MAASSAAQMKDWLLIKGYYNSSTSYKVRYRRSRKAVLTYYIDAKTPYRIAEKNYFIPDPRINRIVREDTANSLVKSGFLIDKEVLGLERDRITTLLRNNGYYNFSREYIYFEIDSTLGAHRVKVGIGISSPANNIRHRVYVIGNIYVEPEFVAGDSSRKDTALIDNMYFISNNMKVKGEVLADNILLKKNNLYKLADYQATINRLSQFRLYKFVEVRFQLDTLPDSATGALNCFIRLTTNPKIGLREDLELNTVEESQAQIVNSSTRSFGSAASLVYTDRNVFKRALQLEVRPRAAVEIPVSFFQNTHAIDTPNYEYGLTNSLIVPRLLLPKGLVARLPRLFPPWSIKDNNQVLNAQTSFNLNFIFEDNKYYKRTTANTNITYQFSKGNIRNFILPFDISLIKTDYRSQQFKDTIEHIGDPLLKNLFDTHLITDFRWIMVVNQQPLVAVKERYWYLRNTFETGGLLKWLVELPGNLSKPAGSTIPASTSTLFGINYFEYVKDEITAVYYLPLWFNTNLVTRGILGLGAPLPKSQSTILPFEKRFVVGGTNSIRAWPLRTLGPGAYQDPTGLLFDRSGDLKIEMNAELRFPIYGVFKGALFTDAGNVWTYNDDPHRPGSEFGAKFFYKELAVGSGVGLRFDFGFFVFRLDFAVPVRDPGYPEGERLVINHIHDAGWLSKATTVNLGVGYPF
jgi:hypothetical protein